MAAMPYTLPRAIVFVTPLLLLAACSSSSSPSSAQSSPDGSTSVASSDDGGVASLPDGAATVTCESFVASTFASCVTPPATGTFPADVAAVLADKCQTCHQSPPINHAPFALLAYADTQKADSICNGVPTWQAMDYVIQPDSNPHMPYGNAPQLTSAEFATLEGWLTGCAVPSSGDGGVTNTVIADQYNNRVIEVDPQGNIVWTFGNGSSVPGPMSVVAPNDAERLPNGETLISGTGTGAGTEPACAADGGGCPDNRVLVVGSDGGIVWEYDDDGGLSSPVSSVMLPNGNILVTDQGNQRIIEVTPQKTIAWQYLPEDDGGPALNNPNSAERLANGDTLIADENNNRVLEVNDAGAIKWQYATTPDAGPLQTVAFASRLPNGNTLITDSGNNRILEVTEAGAVVWSYYTASRSTSSTAATVTGGSSEPNPTRAVRLANGNTLITDQFNDQVIEVGSTGQIVSTYGMLNVAGAAAGQLNGPYDAKRVGDYTGFTPPQ
jgi:hypothetical protein